MRLLCGALLGFQLVVGNPALEGGLSVRSDVFSPAALEGGLSVRYDTVFASRSKTGEAISRNGFTNTIQQPRLSQPPLWLTESSEVEKPSQPGVVRRWIIPVSVTLATGGMVYAVYSIRGR